MSESSEISSLQGILDQMMGIKSNAANGDVLQIICYAATRKLKLDMLPGS